MRAVPFAMLAVLFSAGAQAQDAAPAGPLAKLYACAAMTDPAARLACYDAEVAAVRGAEDAGAFTAVDAGRVAQLQREAFGLPLPNLPKLIAPRLRGEVSEAPAEITATLTDVRRGGDGKLILELDNGQVWRQIDTDKNRFARAGGQVVIKRGAVGSFLATFGAGAALRVKRET